MTDLAIAEEKAKAAKHGNGADAFGNERKPAEESSLAEATADSNHLKVLEAEVMDLKITCYGPQCRRKKCRFWVELIS